VCVGEGSITVVEQPLLAAIVRRCWSDVEVVDRDGTLGRGFTNLKRIYGSHADLATVVSALTTTIASCGVRSQ
jgi:hypothetical protein